MLNFESQIKRARIVLESKGKLAREFLNPEIHDSWMRCLDMGLDPLEEPQHAIIGREALEEIKYENEALTHLAHGELTNLYQQISGSNFAILFSNPDGIILDSVCDRSFGSAANARHLIPGSEWRESLHGTNALGCVIASRQPVTVHAGEHFFRTYNQLTCVAAPVFGPDGNLAGVLDASSDCRERQQHTHALIKMSCISIENGLFKNKLRDKIVLEMHNRPEFLGTLHVGLMAFEEDGRFISANRMASALFQERFIKSGIHFDEIFRYRFADLLGGQQSCNQRYLQDLHGSTFAVNLSVPMGMTSALARSHKTPKEKVVSSPTFIFNDPVLQTALDEISNALQYKVPIHIHGATGTGKEVLARYIHSVSGAKGKFIAVNCANLNDSLAESELFGYRSGAFTGADREGSQGLIMQADGGTLFLDEIGDMPLSLQTTLLRFLDNWSVRPVGSAEEKKVSLNLVTATNRHLETAVNDKSFREDLWYRINTWEIVLPPLRERTDIADIIAALINDFNPPFRLEKEALEELCSHSWPGNIRQLKSLLLRLQIKYAGSLVTTKQIQALWGKVLTNEPHCPHMKLDGQKKEIVQQAYRDLNGNISAVARKLGISRNTVYKLI